LTVLRLLKHPLTVGFFIRVLLIISFFPILHQELFAPFILHTLDFPSIDIWQSWLDSGGRVDAFPYGLPMLVPTAFVVMISNLIAPGSLALASFFLGLLLLFVDLLIIGILDQSSTNSRVAVWLFALTPLGIYISFYHGQLDMIPTIYLALAFVFVDKKKWILAGVFVALAVSAKLSFLLVLPFFVIFFFDNPRFFQGSFLMARSFATTFLLVQVPLFFLPGFQEMVVSTPEANRILIYGIQLSEDLRLLVFPSVYILLLYWLWRVGRSTIRVLIAFTGAALFGIALAAPAAIGWYAWSLPFLAFLAISKNYFYPLLLVIVQLLVLVNYRGGQSGASTRSNSNLDFVDITNLDSPITSETLGTLLLIFGGLFIVSILRRAIGENDTFGIGRRPVSIAIAGDSGVGKDTLAESIARVFGEKSTTYILGDDYHLYERGDSMWNSMTHLDPKANDLTSMDRDLSQAINRLPVRTRHYDHTSGRFTSPSTKKPADLILVNGLHALELKSSKRLVDLKVYLEMEEPLRRRIKVDRDTKKRGTDETSVIDSIERRVPDSELYVLPQRQQADLVVTLCEKESDLVATTEGNFKVKCTIYDFEFVDDFVRNLSSLCNQLATLNTDGAVKVLEIDPTELTTLDYEQIINVMIPDKDQLFSHTESLSSGSKGLVTCLVLVALAERRRLKVLLDHGQ
jgi:uridine kinase